MGMALDEPKEDDEVLEKDGVTVVAEKSLIRDMGGIEVGYNEVGYRRGFIISPRLERLGGCSC